MLVLLAIAVFLVALFTGSSGISAPRALAALAGGGDEATRTVLLAVRLPRVLAGFGVGSLLALSGVLLQALFRNPLADPYVLGVSGGAAVGALTAMLIGAVAWMVPAGAFSGAIASTVVSRKRPGESRSPSANSVSIELGVSRTEVFNVAGSVIPR